MIDKLEVVRISLETFRWPRTDAETSRVWEKFGINHNVWRKVCE